MKTIGIAGATGYLGGHIVKELISTRASFKALARNTDKLLSFGVPDEDIINSDFTNPKSLQGQLEGIDILISTVGITRQKDGLSYMDVDYQANANLLQEAKRSGVRKFIYVSAIHGDQLRNLKIFEAKEKFVDALKSSGLEYVIVRPNGFFSDMRDFLDMAKGGSVYLFGTGEYKLNPIHGTDLAKVIVDTIESDNEELVVGGPDIFTQNEIARLALQAQGKKINLVHLPDWFRTALIKLMRIFTTSKTYGPIEFFLTIMGQDNIAPRFGTQRLKSFFNNEVDRLVSEK